MSCENWCASREIPVTTTLMGLGAFPASDPLVAGHAGHARQRVCQLRRRTRPICCLAFGVRFDDRVTGKVSEFAKHGKIVHIDIDPSEINKNKEAHIPIVSDIKYALAELNKIVEPPEATFERVARADRGLEESGSVQLRHAAFPAFCRNTRSRSCRQL